MPQLTRPIAFGRTAEIYPWEEGQIVKLTRPNFPSYLADQEWKYASLAYQLGAPAPKPIRLVDIDGRRGVVFERIEGPNLVDQMRRTPFIPERHGQTLARLHAGVHALHSDALPSQQERLAQVLREAPLLNPQQREHALRLLASLPDDTILCHGDFHPENILFTPVGPVIIDWESSTRGNPGADVARTCLWIRYALMYGKGLTGWAFRQLGCRLEEAYRAEYQRLLPGKLDRLEDWIYIQAACRMNEENRPYLPHLQAILDTALAVTE